MGVTIYQTPGWDTHREIKLPTINWPLERGAPSHFTVLRTYEGPASTFVKQPLNALDPVFDGRTIAATGESSDEIFTLASDAELFTGCPVVVSNITGGLGGVSEQAYYAIRVAANRIKLATTLANAAAGTAVDVSADGACDITLPVAYLVEHGETSDSGADDVTYTRLYATIPPQWFDAEDYAYTFPGLTPGSAGASSTITSIAGGGLNEVVLGTAITGVAVNDVVTAQVRYTRGGVVYSQGFYGKVLAVSAGVSVTMAGNLLGTVGSASSVTGSISEVAVGRDQPKDMIVDGRIQHDYALTTETGLATDLPRFELFQPTTNAAYETDMLTATTSPTNTEYVTMITSGSEIVVECKRTPYLGNIWVRKTRLLPAK